MSSLHSRDTPPNVRYCMLCDCPLPIGDAEVVCGACVEEYQRLTNLFQQVQAGMCTDWPVRGISHAKMQRRREGPMSRGWEFEVGEINFHAHFQSLQDEPQGEDDDE